MRKLLLCGGLPGSGKPTKALEYTAQGFKHFEADMFFINPKTGVYEFNPYKLRHAHMWCQTSTLSALQEGFNVVVSNTFTQMWEMKPYLEMAKELNIPVEVIECTGQYQNVHGVPEEVIEKMRKRWEKYTPIS